MESYIVLLEPFKATLPLCCKRLHRCLCSEEEKMIHVDLLGWLPDLKVSASELQVILFEKSLIFFVYWVCVIYWS